MSAQWTIKNMKRWYTEMCNKVVDADDYWGNKEKDRARKLREEIMSDEPYVAQSCVYNWIVREMGEHDECREDPKSELICELIQVIADTVHDNKYVAWEVIEQMRDFFNSLPKRRKLRK